MDGVIDGKKIMYAEREHNHGEDYGDDPTFYSATHCEVSFWIKG
jgi:hypothetical protein